MGQWRNALRKFLIKVAKDGLPYEEEELTRRQEELETLRNQLGVAQTRLTKAYLDWRIRRLERLIEQQKEYIECVCRAR
jgi:hypothetical protein